MAAYATFQKGMTMKKVLWVMIVSVITGLVGILSCGSSGISGPAGSNPTMTMTGTYRVSGDSIYIALTTPADTVRYCNGNSLAVDIIDSGGIQSESGFLYSISNNTLTFTVTDTSMNGPGYILGIIITFSREGSGLGVQGTWDLASESQSVLSGTAPASVRHEIDSMNAYINQSIASGKVSEQFIFSAGTQFTIKTSTEMSSTSYSVDYYISSWTSCSPGSYGLDTCSYAVTVVKQGNSAVQLHGKTSGETVTITWNAKGDQTYTSSDPTHLAGTYFANPVSCPNSIPAWFTTFLTANVKTGLVLYKKSAQQMVPKKTPLPKWLRVF
jgi:hypothetical protein